MTPDGEVAKPVTLIKFGGSVLTDKSGEEAVREEVLSRLCAELAKGLDGDAVLGHGSGSFGHRAARAHGCTDGAFPASSPDAAEATRAAALRLHQQVLTCAQSAGLETASCPPADWCRWQDNSLHADPAPVVTALNERSLPIVMGDVVARAEGGWRIASTEDVFLSLASRLPVSRAIWVGDTDGILDRAGDTIASLAATDQPDINPPAGSDVTGGMALRWRAVQTLAARDVESLLINGLRAGELLAALRGARVRGTQVQSIR